MMHGRGRTEANAGPRGHGRTNGADPRRSGDGVVLLPPAGRPSPGGSTLRERLAARPWRLVEARDPASAMARLCLAGLALRERSAWGVAAGRDLVVVIATDDAAAAEELLQAVGRHLPACSAWRATPEGDLVPLAIPSDGRSLTADDAGTPGASGASISRADRLDIPSSESHSPPSRWSSPESPRPDPPAPAIRTQTAESPTAANDPSLGPAAADDPPPGPAAADRPPLRLTGFADGPPPRAGASTEPPPRDALPRRRRGSGLVLSGDPGEWPEPPVAGDGSEGEEGGPPEMADERITAEELAMLFEMDPPADPPEPRG